MALAHRAVHAPRLDLISQCWRSWKSNRASAAPFDRWGQHEIERIAHDLRMTTRELHSLARKRADSARLLYRRMADLGLDRTEVARAVPKVMWDLQKLCSTCETKSRCERDFAHGADLSAWQAYCPNDQTLNALTSQTVKASNRVRAASSSGAVASVNIPHLHVWSWGLFLIGAWLIISMNWQHTNSALVVGSVPTSNTSATNAPPSAGITCLDTGCLSAQQRTALQTMKSVAEQGLINSSINQLQALQQASRNVEDVRKGEALVCGSIGGATYYGLMFRQGCGPESVGTPRLSGYTSCRTMTGGGVCFVK